MSADVGAKRVTISQEQQTLQLAFSERPGDTKTHFNMGNFTVLGIVLLLSHLMTICG